MHVLLIITDYGSFNNFLAELAVSLIRRGYKVNVICSKSKVINYEDKFDFEDYGIKFHFFDFPRGFNLLSHLKISKSIHKIISNINPDLVTIHFTTGMFSTLLLGKPKTETMGTFHGLGYPVIKNRFKKFIFKLVEYYCMFKLDQIWVLNQFDYNLLQKRFKSKVNLMPSKGLGCELKKFEPGDYKLEQTQLKKELGVEDNFVVAYTGRFVNFKGFDLVIKAFKHLEFQNHLDKLKLMLIGGEDPIHPSGLNKQEEEWLKKTDKIINVGFTSEVGKYLSVADLFVFPSYKEGMPVCIMEALAMELPVITTNSRGCSDLIKHNFNGLILPDEPTHIDVADAITMLADDDSLRQKFKKNIARDREQLGRSNFVEQRIELFEKIKPVPFVNKPN